MINPFPTLYLAMLAYTALRVFFGLILVTIGYQHAVTKRIVLEQALSSRFGKLGGFFALYMALIEILLGLMFIAGFYTQIAAIGVFLYSLKMLFFRKTLLYPINPSPAFYALALGAALSLFITGAGAFAFDIPI